jgi:hypothetical protein
MVVMTLLALLPKGEKHVFRALFADVHRREEQVDSLSE